MSALSIATPRVGYYTQNATVGSVFALRMYAQGGIPPYWWSFSGPSMTATGSSGTTYSLPPSGWLQSAPTGSGTDTLTALVVDSAGATATQTVTVTVGTSLTFYPLDLAYQNLRLPGARASTSYSTQLRVAGGTGTGQTYSIQSGSLPSGLSLSSSGLISGSPTAAGNLNSCVVKCVDSASNTATASLYLPVNPLNKGTRPAANTGTGFFVDANGYFRDPNGYLFNFRGLDRTHYDSTSWASGASGAIANPGIVRVFMFDGETAAFAANQVSTQYQPNYIFTLLTLSGVSNVGTSGSTSTTLLNSAVSDWVSYYPTLAPVMNYIGINIANEWGPSNSSTWSSSYISAIATLRSTGYTCPIFVDTGGSGQDIFDILNYGQAVVSSDPQQNTVLAYHSYGNTVAYQAQIASVTIGNPTVLTLNNSGAFHPFNPANNANGAYCEFNQYVVTGAQGLTQLNGNQPSPTNSYGSAGAWQLQFQVNSSGWTGSYVANSASVTGYSTYASGAGGWDYRQMFAAFAALRANGVCVAIMEFGPGNQTGDQSQINNSNNPGPSFTNTTIGQVIMSAEANGLPWCYWAWDDHSTAGGFTGWFADVLGNNGVYTNTASFTAAGLESVANPRYGLWALSQPAASFLPTIFEIVDQSSNLIIDQSSNILTG
jgi:Cellulase (glycosyl hydrolase family 5)/Putative Ig domain